MPEIQFKKGEFETYRATTKFHLGERQIDVWGGDEIEFDGQIVKYQGDSFGAPSIRGAIKAGWLVLASDNVSQYVPKAGGVVVHPAQSSGRERGEPIQMGAIQEEEQEVGVVGDHKNRVKAALDKAAAPRSRPQPAAVAAEPEDSVETAVLQEAIRPQEPPEAEMAEGLVSVAETEVEPPKPRPAALRSREEADEANRAILAEALSVEVPKPSDPNAAYGGTRHDSASDGDEGEKMVGGRKKFAYKAAADDQGGVVVGKIRSTAMGVGVGAEGGGTSTAPAVDVTKTSPLDVEKAMKPVGGNRRPQLPDALKARPKAKTGAVTLADKSAEEEGFEPDLPQGTATQVTEGESLSDTSGGATGDVQEMIAGDDLTDLLPDAVVAGAPPKPKAAKSDSNGFSWDKGLHWTKRVKLAIESYGDQPDAIKKILAVETPSVAKRIQSGLLQAGKTI
jgi:hypothetical protein